LREKKSTEIPVVVASETGPITPNTERPGMNGRGVGGAAPRFLPRVPARFAFSSPGKIEVAGGRRDAKRFLLPADDTCNLGRIDLE